MNSYTNIEMQELATHPPGVVCGYGGIGIIKIGRMDSTYFRFAIRAACVNYKNIALILRR